VASLLGIKSWIFVPSDVPDVTKAHIVREGGQIFTIDGDYDTAVRLAASAAEELGEDHGVLVQDTAWEGYEDIPMVSTGALIFLDGDS
jgi:diaminopropionate ammonia-lyase